MELPNALLTLNADGELTAMSCPHGHAIDFVAGRHEGRFIARIPASICPNCATHDTRESDKAKASPCFTLYFSRSQIDIALRHQRLTDFLASGSNPRAAVEATVRELTCRFDNATLWVRGQCRMAMSLLASATMCNARRIWRFTLANDTDNGTENIIDASPFASFCSFSPFFALLRLLYCLSFVSVTDTRFSVTGWLA
jgi:hypothetical protein